jgi:uncharacterized protein YbjT (DUF2867 family)
MDIVIAGAHGKIARLLVPRLAARGDRVRGVIRSTQQVDDVRSDGAEPVVCDLEAADAAEIDEIVGGADSIVFLAGAGPGSGAERKWTVDHGAARSLIDAAVRQGVRRYVMLSSIGADDPPQDDEVFSIYLRAKAQADADLRAAGLDHTIVRPTTLTDDPGRGTVSVGDHVEHREIARDDVAAVLDVVLHDERTVGRTFELTSGDTPIEDVASELS